MIPMIEPVLYRDAQQEKPACFCRVCGGECYLPSLICLRCERRSP